VSLTTKVIELYDSLHRQRHDVLRNILTLIEAIFKKFDKEFIASEWRLVNSNHMIQLQTDGFNCGLFVIWNGLCLAHMNRPMKMPRNYRQVVLKWVTNGSLVDFDDLEFEEL
jgi:Ulp1 family protease